MLNQLLTECVLILLLMCPHTTTATIEVPSYYYTRMRRHTTMQVSSYYSIYTGGGDERMNTLNQLLTEMDGFEGNPGIICLAATNRFRTTPMLLTKALTH
jgi:hypothetical protein